MHTNALFELKHIVGGDKTILNNTGYTLGVFLANKYYVNRS